MRFALSQIIEMQSSDRIAADDISFLMHVSIVIDSFLVQVIYCTGSIVKELTWMKKDEEKVVG